MPLLDRIYWSRDKSILQFEGERRIRQFCRANGIDVPNVGVRSYEVWPFPSVCAYYRPQEGIQICVEHCQTLAPDMECRNWSWPGSTTDRTPFGVMAHELGHHCDYLMGEVKGTYWSNYGNLVMETSKEAPLTSYCPNSAEGFAEMFRLFVTNHQLLKQLRPKTYKLLIRNWRTVGYSDWKTQLGSNVPSRILRTLRNKGAR